MKKSPLAFVDFLLAPGRASLVLMATCAGALATAFIAQYAFGQKPCILCLWQRIPFAVAIVLMGAAFGVRKQSTLTRNLFLATGLLFLGEAGLAFFHTGVEQLWWSPTGGCAVTPLIANGGDIASLREALLAEAVARCDVISWTFLGFSMANWNVPFSLGLSLFAFLAAHVEKTGRALFANKKENRQKPVSALNKKDGTTPEA